MDNESLTNHLVDINQIDFRSDRSPLEDCIKKGIITVNITDRELDKRFENGLINKLITGDQWFRDYKGWHQLRSTTKPHMTVFRELQILLKNEKNITSYSKKRLKVFYGIGLGDTEGFPILWDVEKNKYSEIYAIDAVPYYLETLVIGLRNIQLGFPGSKIMFKGNLNLLENLKKSDLRLDNSKYKKRCHICLGNTVGTFNQDYIFSLFKELSDVDDVLLLGHYTDAHPRGELALYEGNKRFSKFILSPYIKKRPDLLKQNKIEWNYNEETGYVEAWLGNILIYRSKLYNLHDLSSFVKRYGFETLETFTYMGWAVTLLEKYK